MFINLLVKTFKALATVFLMLTVMACQEDLYPQDNSSSKSLATTTGYTLDDFTVSLNTGQAWTLSEQLTNFDAVVLYFTMWCPVCDSHMQHIRSHLISSYPNVNFIMVDYVSGSHSHSRASQLNSGYSDFEVIADTNDYLQDVLQGTMGSIVVIDKNFVVQLNQYFKNDQTLKATLDSL